MPAFYTGISVFRYTTYRRKFMIKKAVIITAMSLMMNTCTLNVSAAGGDVPETGNISFSTFAVPAVILAISIIAKKKNGKK